MCESSTFCRYLHLAIEHGYMGVISMDWPLCADKPHLGVCSIDGLVFNMLVLFVWGHAAVKAHLTC